MKTLYMAPLALLLVIGCSDANVNDPAASTTATDDMDRHEVARPIIDDPALDSNPNTGAATPSDTTTPSDPAMDPATSSTGSTSSSPSAGADSSPLGQNDNQSGLDATTNIRSQLEAANLTTSTESIDITTQNGQVTLDGQVASQEEKDQIEKIATDIAGAGNVTNNLKIAQ